MSPWPVAAIVIVAGGVGIGMLGSSAGDGAGNGSPAADGAAPQTESPTSTDVLLLHEMGEAFTVGAGARSVQYRVTDAVVTSHVGSSSFGADADGVFLVVI